MLEIKDIIIDFISALALMDHTYSLPSTSNSIPFNLRINYDYDKC